MTEIPKFIEKTETQEGINKFQVNEKLINNSIGMTEKIENAISAKISQLNNNPDITTEELDKINELILKATEEFEKYMIGEKNNLDFATQKIIKGDLVLNPVINTEVIKLTKTKAKEEGKLSNFLKHITGIDARDARNEEALKNAGII